MRISDWISYVCSSYLVDVLRFGLLSLPVEPQVRRDLVADAHRSSPHVNGVLSDDRRSVEDPSLRLQSALVVPARQGESSPPAPPPMTLRGNAGQHLDRSASPRSSSPTCTSRAR